MRPTLFACVASCLLCWWLQPRPVSAGEADRQLMDFSIQWNPSSGQGPDQLLAVIAQVLAKHHGAQGEYDPATGLHLEYAGLALDVSPGALPGKLGLSMRRLQSSDGPPAPGDILLTGVVLEPDGTVFSASPQVSVPLTSPGIYPQLPVLTLDASGTWVGTGEMARIDPTGMARFSVSHFSPFGIPDTVPPPPPGDAVGSFVVVSNNGVFSSEVISSTMGSLLFSEFGDTFDLTGISQKISMQGKIVTKALGLHTILLTRYENYVIGIVGGGQSIYNAGQFNEPVLGVMIMSVKEGNVSISVYAATVQRVIIGTFTGRAL